jgi:hypothetical protein
VTTKKEVERWQLERFKEVWPAFPKGPIIESEGPDFLVEHDGRLVGVELTQFFREPAPGEGPRQEQEQLRRRIVTRAQELFGQRGGPPLAVGVFFSQYQTLSKGDVQPLAMSLADYIASLGVPPESRAVVDAADDEHSSLPEAFTRLHVGRFDVLTEPSWAAPDAGYITDADPGHLQRIVDGKNDLVPTYRAKADELWLVIVAHGFAISSTVTMGADALSSTYRSAFDRVFLLQSFDRRVWELAIAKPAVGE